MFLDWFMTLPVFLERDKKRLLHYADHRKPLFVGHYWLRGMPKLLKPNLACLDYSACKTGRLVAYRMQAINGEGRKTLAAKNFVWVDVTEDQLIA